MKADGFRVAGIDHVELFVPNRYEAAEWYRRVLGLEILKEYEGWAEPGPGPLMISSDSGKTKLALFDGPPQGSAAATGFRRLAFGVDGGQFISFLRRLDELAMQSRDGGQVSREDVVDHDKSFSIYFTDPWGNPLEVTTYDLAPVRAFLRSNSSEG